MDCPAAGRLRSTHAIGAMTPAAWRGLIVAKRTRRTRCIAQRSASAPKGANTWRLPTTPAMDRATPPVSSADQAFVGSEPGRAPCTSRSRSEPRSARPRGGSRHAPSTATGSRRPIGGTRSRCSRSRPRPACRRSSRSGMGECWCRRSRSSAVPRTRWRPTSPMCLGPDWMSSSAAMRTCPTSAGSPLPIGDSCSASTTSTRRCPGPSNGTSSGSLPAWPSPAAIAASTRSSVSRSTRR